MCQRSRSSRTSRIIRDLIARWSASQQTDHKQLLSWCAAAPCVADWAVAHSFCTRAAYSPFYISTEHLTLASGPNRQTVAVGHGALRETAVGMRMRGGTTRHRAHGV